MITLEKALKVAETAFTDNKEKLAIKLFIKENGFESDYIGLILELVESKTRKLENEINQHQWLQFGDAELFDDCYKKKMKPEMARLLSEVQRRNIMGISNEPFTEELKEACKEVNTPQVYWREALIELHKLGVLFKDNDKYTYTDTDVFKKSKKEQKEKPTTTEIFTEENDMVGVPPSDCLGW